MSSSQTGLSSQISQVLQSNRAHQEGLRSYIEKLEFQLAQATPLLDVIQTDEDREAEDEIDTGGYISIPGSQIPESLLLGQDYVDENSPFHEDATRRMRYVGAVDGKIMTDKIVATLREAVRNENYRLEAYELRRRGEQPLSTLASRTPESFEINIDGIRWDDVATKVSTPGLTFSAEDCRIRWLGFAHPSINHGPWTDEEAASLKVLLGDTAEGEIDWVEVAEDLGTGRTPIDCMRHSVIRDTLQWNRRQESTLDERLLNGVEKYGSDNWYLVARKVSDKATPVQCEGRYTRIKPDMRKVPWTTEEDERLRVAHEVYGSSWVEIAHMLKGRSNHQCSERWNELQATPAAHVTDARPSNVPTHASLWSKAEEQALWNTVGKTKQPNWAQVAAQLNHQRPMTAYKTRYKQLERKLATNPKYFDDTVTDEEETAIVPVTVEAPRPRRRSTRSQRRDSMEANVAGPSSTSEVNIQAPQKKPKPRPRKVVKSVATLSTEESEL